MPEVGDWVRATMGDNVLIGQWREDWWDKHNNRHRFGYQPKHVLYTEQDKMNHRVNEHWNIEVIPPPPPWWSKVQNEKVVDRNGNVFLCMGWYWVSLTGDRHHSYHFSDIDTPTRLVPEPVDRRR